MAIFVTPAKLLQLAGAAPRRGVSASDHHLNHHMW